MERRLKVAINGFGRVGRAFFRICLKDPNIEIVAINDLHLATQDIAYLSKYDSIYGLLPNIVEAANDWIIVDGRKIMIHQINRVKNVHFENQNIDVLIHSSGDLSDLDDQLNYLEQSPFFTVFTNHSFDTRIKKFYFGIEEPGILKSSKLISLSTCDAAAILPIFYFLINTYGVESASIVTLHPYLGNQNLLDGKSPANDLELGRSAINSLIPKSTSLEPILKELFPKHKDSVVVMSFRVPTDSVSNANMHLLLRSKVDKEILQKSLFEWCSKKCPAFGHYSREQCVSRDYRETQYSFIIDHRWIDCVKNQARISIWYDNEWGYASRLHDCLRYLF